MSNSYLNAVKLLKVGRKVGGKYKKNPTAKGILFFLADGANDGGFFCYGDINYIANITEYGESTVRKAIDYLVEEKFIEKRSLGRKNGYQLLFDAYQKKNHEKSGLDLHQEIDNQKQIKDFLDKTTKLVCAVMKVFTLPNRERWHKAMRWAYENNWTSEEIADCYKLRFEMPGRNFPVTPEQVIESLPDLKRLKSNERKTKFDFNETEPEVNYVDDFVAPVVSKKENEIWQNILVAIEKQLNIQIFDSWFSTLILRKVENNQIHIIAKKVQQDWINTYYHQILDSSLQDFEIVWEIREQSWRVA